MKNYFVMNTPEKNPVIKSGSSSTISSTQNNEDTKIPETNKNGEIDEIIASCRYNSLNWKNTLFSYNVQGEELIVIHVPGDGSCLLHSIVRAYYIPYIQGFTMDKNKKKSFDRVKFISSLRRDLSIKLGNKIDPKISDSPIWYDDLNEGLWKELSESNTVPNKKSKHLHKLRDIRTEFSLTSMKKILNSAAFLDSKFFEFFSRVLGKDLYVLSQHNKDVYIFGSDIEKIYQTRDSIVILWTVNHFELIAIKIGLEINTLFHPEHNFIKTIQKRMKVLTKKS